MEELAKVADKAVNRYFDLKYLELFFKIALSCFAIKLSIDVLNSCNSFIGSLNGFYLRW